MFAFFKKPFEPQKSQNQGDYVGDFDKWIQRKNAVIKRLLEDFPWLWAVNNHYNRDDGDRIKVNQDMSDLKLVLSQNSDKTGFLLWSVASHFCDSFNVLVKCHERQEGKIWSEAITQQSYGHRNILYLVSVDWGSSGHGITIFRHPEKQCLDEVIQQVCDLHGVNARRLISSDFV
jgi:hypothetical protein